MLTSIQAPKGPAICRDEKLKSAKVLLIEWQLNTWLSCYSKAPYGPQALLPDDVLHKITSSLRIEMIDDLKRIGWSSSCAERHGAAILQALQAHNEQFDVTQNIEKTERLEAKKQKMAERQAVQCATVKAEHECAKAIKHSQPKPPHLSHAKKPVLLESGCTPLQVPNHTPSPIMIVAPQPHPASSMPSSIYITSTGNPYPTLPVSRPLSTSVTELFSDPYSDLRQQARQGFLQTSYQTPPSSRLPSAPIAQHYGCAYQTPPLSRPPSTPVAQCYDMGRQALLARQNITPESTSHYSMFLSHR